MNAILEKQQVLPLPEGYTMRGGNINDYKIACDLLNAHSQHLNGCDDLNDPETETDEVYRTFVDSFKDHFGFIVPPFEKGLADFKHNFIEEPGYDPRFWFVAMAGDEMVGICLCRPQDAEDTESGWVSELGVQRAWRKRGLGYALLKHAFAAFHAAGRKRAGMRVLRQFNQYEKELRPGKELAVESIE